MKPELATDVIGVALPRLVVHLDLFSGIGGFALAAQMVGGIKTVAFCEIDPWARRVLNKNFPNVPVHEDVKTLDPSKYGTIDLITGGYPCQPFSLSGKRQGEDDDRHLWPEVRRITAEARPRWVLCENVIGHVTMGLDQVLDDLASLGYAAEAIVLPACAVGNWHRRDRVWIVAHNSRQHLQKPQVVDAETLLSELGGTADEARLRVAEWEADQPSMVGVAHGIPHWVDRARGTGNAIVPQVAAEILRCMMRVDSLHNANVDLPDTAAQDSASKSNNPAVSG
jgi:DNA (cytosine-5)-methyltransferase 1